MAEPIAPTPTLKGKEMKIQMKIKLNKELIMEGMLISFKFYSFFCILLFF